jgi:hypothetical protein
MKEADAFRDSEYFQCTDTSDLLHFTDSGSALCRSLLRGAWRVHYYVT